MPKVVKESEIKVDNPKKMKCPICGKVKTKTRDFFMSKDPRFQIYDNRCYYCKDCLKDLCFTNGIPDKDGFKKVLSEYLNLPYFENLYREALDNEKDTLGWYISQLNIRFKNQNLTWEDGEKSGQEISKGTIDILKVNAVITDEDIQVEKDVIRLLGYAPFDGYDKFDKKYLYGELLPYLNEDTLEDQYKISVIIQIVNNNNQIRKIDLVVNQMSGDSKSLIKNGNDIKNLTAIKTQLTQATDKLAKENAISVKNRGDSSAGKSTLGGIMKDLRELGFEEAEQNYYTMKKSYGMKVSADISHKSILEIVHFDSNDEHTLFKMQKELIGKLQEKELDYKEEIRKLLIENKQLKDRVDNIVK